MTKGTRTTLILVAIAAVLAAYFFLVERPRQRQEQQRARAEAVLASFNPNDATLVAIDRPDAKLEFVKQSSGWWMTSPLKDRAEVGSVMRLVAAISEGEVARDLGPQADLTQFGLAEPAASITVLANADTLVALDVGHLTVDKYHAYARAAGGSVLLVPTAIRRYSLAAPSEFRKRRVVDFDISSVVSYTVRCPAYVLICRRNSGFTGWEVGSEGKTYRGNKERVESNLHRLRGLRVQQFVPAAEVQIVTPFEPLTGSVLIELDDGTQREVTVGRRLESMTYVGTDTRVVLVDSTVSEVFAASPSDLRDRRLLRFDRGHITKVSVESDTIRVTLIRPGEEWVYPNPSLGRVNQRKVGRALTAVSNLEYSRLVEENLRNRESYGLSNPDLRLTIFDEDGAPLDWLACKRRETAPVVYLVTSKSTGVIAELELESLDAVVSKFTSLRDP